MRAPARPPSAGAPRAHTRRSRLREVGRPELPGFRIALGHDQGVVALSPFDAATPCGAPASRNQVCIQMLKPEGRPAGQGTGNASVPPGLALKLMRMSGVGQKI